MENLTHSDPENTFEHSNKKMFPEYYKTCVECGKIYLASRINQKFGPGCKAHHDARIQSELRARKEKTKEEKIKANGKILKEFVDNDIYEVTRDELSAKGFDERALEGHIDVKDNKVFKIMNFFINYFANNRCAIFKYFKYE